MKWRKEYDNQNKGTYKEAGDKCIFRSSLSITNQHHGSVTTAVLRTEISREPTTQEASVLP